MKKVYITIIILFSLIFVSQNSNAQIKNGADRLDILLPQLTGKRVALVVNQSSRLENGVHLLDALLSADIDVKKIFAPEHGFRGGTDAGEKIRDGKDVKTGIEIISLYGNNTKPSPAHLTDVDVVVFDIQDVGARFYTYISTMHYVMKACAENAKQCIILDRPNPNDHIDGPILDPKFKSFVGMHPIPLLHGLTVGELAEMINGEGWLADGDSCRLSVVKVEGWKHGESYSLSVRPSPNLPNDQAVKLYPSLCFFESTKISIGRGTDFPFQVVGGPALRYGTFSFTPRPMPGATDPLLKNQKCFGLDLRNIQTDGSLNLSYIINFYRKAGLGGSFFSSPRFMDLLSGTNTLRLQIMANKSEKEIRAGWQSDLIKYKEMRKKYLLYEDSRY